MKFMKYISWRFRLSILLILLSIFFYLIYYVIFKDIQNMVTWIMMSIAFLPINILIVTLIIEQVISERDKHIMLKKLNMVIGAFYSEVGTDLLKLFSGFDSQAGEFNKNLIFNNNWSKREFFSAINLVKSHDFKIDSKIGDLKALRKFLLGKRVFLLRLLENPNLLEHETFTELLWAVFHLTEELANRVDVDKLSNADYDHISNDIKRAYALLISEWLMYMKHLKEDYPYLFSLALRTNPFDPDASPEIK